MKRQNHGMTINTDKQWPIEDIEERINIQHAMNDHTDIGSHRPAKARDKMGSASDHYHRAVSILAYGFWESRGHTHGTSDKDWFKAEAELKPLWSADLSYSSMDSEDSVDRETS
jgi:hypothetical protein